MYWQTEITKLFGNAGATGRRRRGVRFVLKTVLALAVALRLAGSAVNAEDGNLVADDKEIRLSVPEPMKGPLPLQLGSSVRAQYTADQTDGLLQLGGIAFEEKVTYPPFWEGITAGNSVGDKLVSSVRDGTPTPAEKTVFLKSWLSKQWAGVDFSLTHTRMIERADNQFEFGVSKTFSAFKDNLFFSVGRYWFNDPGIRYWYQTTDVAVDYGWKHWGVSLFAEQGEDASTREHSVGAAVKKTF